MEAQASGLILCLLGLVLLRRDLRGLWRRLRWQRAEATVVFHPTAAGPLWRFDFVLPDGKPVSVPTMQLRTVAPRTGPGKAVVLYDPRDPGREVEVVGDRGFGIGLALLTGLGLLGLGLSQLMR